MHCLKRKFEFTEHTTGIIQADKQSIAIGNETLCGTDRKVSKEVGKRKKLRLRKTGAQLQSNLSKLKEKEENLRKNEIKLRTDGEETHIQKARLESRQAELTKFEDDLNSREDNGQSWLQKPFECDDKLQKELRDIQLIMSNIRKLRSLARCKGKSVSH